MFDLIVKSHSRRPTHMLPFKNAGIPQENYILIELQEDYLDFFTMRIGHYIGLLQMPGIVFR